MRNLVLALALGLSGCATTSSQYGNFVQSSAVLDQQKIAADAVQQLARLYAPARTRLTLQQSTPDLFGQALVKALRAKGYALSEFDSTGASAPSQTASQPSAPAIKAVPDSLPLRYVLDQAGDDSNLYRLTLMVGNQSITRPYLEQGGTIAPAGYWMRKE